VNLPLPPPPPPLMVMVLVKQHGHLMGNARPGSSSEGGVSVLRRRLPTKLLPSAAVAWKSWKVLGLDLFSSSLFLLSDCPETKEEDMERSLVHREGGGG
jgi:hypothetical protein